MAVGQMALAHGGCATWCCRRAFYSLGRDEDAVEAWQAALEDDPACQPAAEQLAAMTAGPETETTGMSASD